MTSQEWSPKTQLARLDRDFEDVIDRFMRHEWGVEKQPINSHLAPAIESFIEAGHLVIRADLPGVDPKNVEIMVNENVLTISAVRVAIRRNRDAASVIARLATELLRVRSRFQWV